MIARRLSVLVLLVLNACGGGPAGNGTGGTVVSYCEVQPIIETRCLSCHRDPPQNGAPTSLDSYEDAYRVRALINLWVGDKRMPPRGDPLVVGNELTDEERALLLQWIDDGATDCVE